MISLTLSAQTTNGWIPLFNGKTLAGWHPSAKTGHSKASNNQSGGKWVVENVTPYYEPLTRPTQTLGRHLFWANFHISRINAKSFPGMITAGTLKEAENLKEWLGIRYGGSIYYKGNHCPGQVLRNCVHPDLGLHVLNEALNPSQPSLFRGS